MYANPTRPHLGGYDVAGASQTTGIEAARIRFFHREFSSFFRAPPDGAGRESFDDREIELIRRLNRWVFDDSLPISRIHARLARPQGGLRVISVTSGKGGVGKTTIAINLAVSIASAGFRTLLFDADLGLANVHVFAGINPSRTVADLVSGGARAEEALTDGPGGIKVLCGGSGIADLARLDPRSVANLGGELVRLAGLFDVIVVDTGAGISAHVIEFLRIADDIVVVVTPDIASTLDAYGVIKVTREAGLKGRIQLVINQVESDGQSDQVAERMRACSRRFLNFEPRVLGTLTRDAELQEANQRRQPLAAWRPDADSSRRFAAMAASLTEGGAASGVEEANRGERVGRLVTRLRSAARPAPAHQSPTTGGSHGRAF